MRTTNLILLINKKIHAYTMHAKWVKILNYKKTLYLTVCGKRYFEIELKKYNL